MQLCDKLKVNPDNKLWLFSAVGGCFVAVVWIHLCEESLQTNTEWSLLSQDETFPLSLPGWQYPHPKGHWMVLPCSHKTRTQLDTLKRSWTTFWIIKTPNDGLSLGRIPLICDPSPFPFKWPNLDLSSRLPLHAEFALTTPFVYKGARLTGD